MVEIRVEAVGERRVPYAEGLALQLELHSRVREGRCADTVILLEHEPVYTAGKLTRPEERPAGDVPVVDVDRGGKITWHGPGQLVGYPIIKLAKPIDVVAYVRSLESTLIDTVGEFGINAHRVDGRAGVWVTRNSQAAKVAAIGVRVALGTTRHGFALNCSNDLEPFSKIVACGIRDAGVTSISELVGRQVNPVDVVDVVAEKFARFGQEMVA